MPNFGLWDVVEARACSVLILIPSSASLDPDKMCPWDSDSMFESKSKGVWCYKITKAPHFDPFNDEVFFQCILYGTMFFLKRLRVFPQFIKLGMVFPSPIWGNNHSVEGILKNMLLSQMILFEDLVICLANITVSISSKGVSHI